MRHCPTCGAPVSNEATRCHVDGTALDAPATGRPTDLVGTTVAGRYRVDRCLGVGGMGAVYVARHLTMELDVALKVMLPDRVNPKTMARFMREAQAASRIDHENVIGVLDFGQTDLGHYFLVMEYVSGVSLDSELRKTSPFPIDRALHVLAQVAAGLARTHELGIIHRDLKPENILLSERDGDRDFVKLIDFGLAKALEPEPGSAPLTHEGDVFGTPEYMPPEQWQGLATDARSDIYGFGVVAYEVVTGKLPFEGDLGELMRGHLERAPIAPNRRRAGGGVPEPLEKVILGALEKDPNRRIASMQEVLALLGEAMATLPPRTGSLSYAKTLPAARAVDPEALPDPTIFHGGMKIAWDAPTLASEVRRLHSLHGKRLADLAQQLWSEIPESVARGLARSHVLERRIAEEAEAVVHLREQLEETRQASLEQSAHLRAAIIDSSVRIQRLDETLPVDGASHPPPIGEPGLPEEPLRRRDAAERLLAQSARRWDEQVQSIETEVGARLRVLREVEGELGPVLDGVGSEIDAEGKLHPELRPQFRELGRIRRAVAAFRALLDGIAGA